MKKKQNVCTTGIMCQKTTRKCNLTFSILLWIYECYSDYWFETSFNLWMSADIYGVWQNLVIIFHITKLLTPVSCCYIRNILYNSMYVGHYPFNKESIHLVTNCPCFHAECFIAWRRTVLWLCSLDTIIVCLASMIYLSPAHFIGFLCQKGHTCSFFQKPTAQLYYPVSTLHVCKVIKASK